MRILDFTEPFRTVDAFCMPSIRTIDSIEVASRDPRLEQLTEGEIRRVLSAQINGYGEMLRRCLLGIMNTGADSDSTSELMETYPDFRSGLHRSRQGLAFTFDSAPKQAFVSEGTTMVMKEAILEHACAAVRDLVYMATQIGTPQTPEQITDAVYKILRHAGFFDIEAKSPYNTSLHEEMRRCFVWGGHSISKEEYAYTKRIGNALAFALFELITGCGPGSMRGPFSGATSAYKERRISGAKMIGLTCPSIITSESPNIFVDPLIILQNIEQRLEAFIRGANGGIVVPGGPGTAEEIMTILSILLHEKNNNMHYPLVFTSSQQSASYFEAIDAFLRTTLGESVQGKYQVIVDDPEQVADVMRKEVLRGIQLRDALDQSYTWFSRLHIPGETQVPFEVSHEYVAALDLTRNQPPYRLAAQLRRLFSAIVYGNVSDAGIRMVREHGPFKVHGERDVVEALDTLLRRFTSEGRMKIKGDYVPCYEIKATV